MNRRNYTLHFALAGALVVLAAAAGRIERWEGGRVIDAPRSQVVIGDAAPAAAPRRPVARYEEGEAEVLVRFKAGVSGERIEEIAASLNDRVEDEIESVEGLAAIDDLDNEEAERTAAEYAALPEVEYAEPNFRIEVAPPGANHIEYGDGRLASPLPPGGPNDPLLAEQWGLVNTGQRDGRAEADISAFAAWDKTQGSKKVVVAVLDSGVDYTHPDLAGNMWHRPDDIEMYRDDQLGLVDDYDGFSALAEERDPMDENGHGTHCAGIVGAEGDNNLGVAGVNWRVEIMPLKFMGRGGFGSTKDAVASINYVIARKKDGVNVRVISASWGSTARSKALEDVIRKAGEADILFVAAAGNDGADADKRPHYPSGYKLPNVLSVAALDRRDELTSFSNYGAKGVHVAAPGKEILSTWLGGTYREASGTSMATPFVAGVAGLILSVEPNLSVKELRDRLTGTVDKLDSLKGKVSSGGRVNAARAVGAVQIK
ncbi:MAG TPA: S8 family serine peptidase [Pyrinomonadaceae bacterium]|nr:S8 family serine peptidase [Pyrinomonadaceae bacterium]